MTHVTKFVIGGKVKKEIRKELDVELDAEAELDDIPNPQEEIFRYEQKEVHAEKLKFTTLVEMVDCFRGQGFLSSL